uniref:PRKG1_interact domain-containing protein n=1 Tax=Elaeophora elaphi TaxID=1147741 RepID=A0A0R3S610_9BILA
SEPTDNNAVGDDDDDVGDDDNTLFPPVLSLSSSVSTDLWWSGLCECCWWGCAAMADCLLLNTLIKSVRNFRAGRSRSRRPPPRDLDQGPVAASNSVSTHYKNQKYDEALVNENKMVAFPSVAMYESSCNDVVYIKSQLLELRKLLNASEAEDANKSPQMKTEDSDVVQRLIKENDALRKELIEKDKTISKLKAQMLLH